MHQTKAADESVIRVDSSVPLTYPTSQRVVIFGVPENMESYLQAVRRGERDGSDVLSILFYRAYHLCHCDPTMRAFVENKVKCRHVETGFETVF